MKYYIITNEVGTILGVYGSALEEFARENGVKIANDMGCKVALHQILSKDKPYVGQSISMRNVEWL